jgi:hypothetical protein
LSPEALSLELHRARLAYVPFPDGASERRASLLALLEHRVPTITTAGSATTPGLRAATVIASSPDAAHASLQRVDAHEWSSLAARGSEYVSARSWPAIAARHEELYRTIVLPRPSR